MGYAEMVKLIQSYQDNSEIPFDLTINNKNKTIQIEYSQNTKQ